MTGGEALLGIRMQHPWNRNPAIKKRSMPLPLHRPTLTAAGQDGPPQTPQPMHENAQPMKISRNSVVLVITQRDLPKPPTDQRRRLMLPADQLCFDRMQLRHHPLL